MVKSNSLRVHLMVLLYDSFNSGLSHAESARIHGVGVSTSSYAARWCCRIHSAAGSFVPRGVMIHSDRGGLYRCREYLRFAREHGVVRSMSGRGSRYDNAVIESHFGNLKGRLGRLDRVPADKAAEMIDEAVRYFNEERILLKLGGLSPAEFLREYEKRQERGRKSAADI